MRGRPCGGPVATVVRIAPTLKIKANTRRVYFLPILADTGALLNAPKNAPACRTATTFDEMLFDFFLSSTPLGSMMPNCSLKYRALTTPPPTPVS
jgi:hypothetical protein